jgi:hypothetical protein
MINDKLKMKEKVKRNLGGYDFLKFIVLSSELLFSDQFFPNHGNSDFLI